MKHVASTFTNVVGRLIRSVVKAAAIVALAFPAASAVSPTAARSEPPSSGWTARSVFWLLPATIFESTPDGLDPEEKDELLVHGKSGHWVVLESTPDLLEIASRPRGESTVLVRLFRRREDPGLMVAVGTDSGPVCAAELWDVDARGRATPAEPPAEPDLLDFFAPGTRVPPDVTASLPLCVTEEGLRVRPLFWTSTGLAHVMVDNAVFYVWTGSRFSKRIVPLPPYPSPDMTTPQEDAPVYVLPEDFPDDARP